MTFNRNKPTDRAATNNLLNNIPNLKNKPNWLGHRGGNAEIDYELLSGTTMQSMQKHRGAVKEHLRHLEKEHGLIIDQHGNIFKFRP
ncbi:hypothetical protein [Acinetobacter brisouii]|uniref:hypothetical protein n=1 Tax=Acinetobacter brisouii TaxID=396323 RepID=UPI0005F820BE|nr:hypothetical protein [Acinetobacter brisouii]KJV38121.1 hypothetical protein VH98_10510 [Acinetobacter brisouii]